MRTTSARSARHSPNAFAGRATSRSQVGRGALPSARPRPSRSSRAPPPATSARGSMHPGADRPQPDGSPARLGTRPRPTAGLRTRPAPRGCDGAGHGTGSCRHAWHRRVWRLRRRAQPDAQGDDEARSRARRGTRRRVADRRAGSRERAPSPPRRGPGVARPGGCGRAASDGAYTRSGRQEGRLWPAPRKPQRRIGGSSAHERAPPRRSRPVRAVVGAPSRTATSPFTTTWSIPDGWRPGSS
jgi:hypothetical protein